jgi:hypothetical protein
MPSYFGGEGIVGLHSGPQTAQTFSLATLKRHIVVLPHYEADFQGKYSSVADFQTRLQDFRGG